jgi:DNA-binding response OmpR family regulator
VEARVLITSHDLELAVSLRRAFGEAGIPAEVLGTRERLEDAGSEAGLLILTADPRGGRGRALLEEAAERGGPPVLGISSDGTLPDRATCRRLGVAECFPRSAVPDELVLISRRLLQRARLREITGIVGSTEAMEEALERVVQIAPVDSTVLIQGESGTGKELVARGIHALSPRRHRPFIAVNVAALPETLLESELFGHEKGAFTGASGLRKGLFELAHGGTIFLDEIGEMPPGTQTKLLRVLEEREFRRVGGEESIRVNVRVVAATNRELRREVLEGASVATSITGSTSSASTCRRCGSDAPTSRSSSATSSPSSARSTTGRRWSWSRRRSASSWTTGGRETSASCATWWSPWWCWRPGVPSAPPTSLPRSGVDPRASSRCRFRGGGRRSRGGAGDRARRSSSSSSAPWWR